MQDMYNDVANTTTGPESIALNGPSQSATTGNASANSSSPLLKLPNELILDIAGYVTPTASVAKDQGYGHGYKHEIPWIESDTTQAREKYASETRDLLNLSLTCKIFTPITQNVLCRNVSLLQPQQVSMSGLPSPSPLALFLRTMLERPDLAARVRSLLVWIWKEKPLDFTDDTDHQALMSLIDSLNISVSEKEAWLADLDYPMEATVCALIFAALPQLQSVHGYAKHSPRSVMAYADPEQTHVQVPRLSQGLATTHITSLTLSDGLNVIHTACLPSLKALTVDFDGPNQLVTIGKGNFANVHTLKVQHTLQSSWPDETLCKKFSTLLHGLRSLRTIEFVSSACLPPASLIPDQVETIKCKEVEENELEYICGFLAEQSRKGTLPRSLDRVEVFWREKTCSDHAYTWKGVHELAAKVRVKVVAMSRDGDLYKVFE